MVLSVLKQGVRAPYKLLQARRIQRPALNTQNDVGRQPTVAFAGHDFKFLDTFIGYLQSQGTGVIVDDWLDHTWHGSVTYRESIVETADVIWCEWGLGNALWYAKHKRAGQRLIVRVHAQELRTNHLAKIDHGRVDQFIFVAEHIKKAALERFRLPAGKCIVIPNYVDTDKFDHPKYEGTEFNIGFVGLTPRSKRLDLALEVIKQVRAVDSRYRLHIKGKLPKEYPWLMRDAEQRAYYDKIFDELAFDAELNGSVVWHPHGDDLPEFYQNIGHVISTSDHEAFHYTVAEGAASGARPHVLPWAGADQMYPQAWLAAQPSGIAQRILASLGSTEQTSDEPTNQQSDQYAEYIRENFDLQVVFPQLQQALGLTENQCITRGASEQGAQQ